MGGIKMKLKTILAGTLLLSISTFSGIQVYADAKPNELIKTDVVYTLMDSAPEVDNDEAEKQMYRDKAYQILADYFGLTQDKLPKDSTINVRLLNTASLAKEKAKWVQECQEQLTQKKITQAEFDETIKDIYAEYDAIRNNLQKLGRDDVICQLSSPNFGLPSNDSIYYININPNTKEVYSARVPMTDKGWETQTTIVGPVGEKSKEFSVPESTVTARKAFCEEFIKKHHLGGIDNPEFVQIHGATHNHYIYKSADNTKYVLIGFDPSTTTKVTDTADIKEFFL